MDMGLDLQQTTVIVTGAGGQIGRLIVDAFLSAGCYVGAIDIDKSKFAIKHENLHWVAVDITNEDSIKSAWQEVENRFSSYPSVCVCAAAMDLSFLNHHSSMIDMSTEQFRRTIDVNLTGTFITARQWLRRLNEERKKGANGIESSHQYATPPRDTEPREQRNTSLIIIGSEAGVLGVPGNPDYAASKSAVQCGLMLSLAPDAARIHPKARVNSVCPGAVDTPLFRKECGESESARWIDSEATVVSRKPVEAEHIARMCLFLASDRWSGSMTGQALRVDGGKSGRLFWTENGSATW